MEESTDNSYGHPIDLSQYSASADPSADMEKVLIAESEIEIGDKLASGCFGSVYRGTWNGKLVAIKQMKNETNVEAEKLFKEARIMK